MLIAITSFSVLNALINYFTLTILAYLFGSGSEIDAFFAAMTVPQVIIAILQVTVPATFIPLFIKSKMLDETNAWRVASIALHALLLPLGVFAVVGAFFPEAIIRIFNPGLPASTVHLAASLFRWFILSSACTTATILLASIYQAQKRFLRPLVAQVFCSSVVLLSVLLLHDRLGLASIAIGTLAGALIQFVLLHPVLFRRGRYVLSFEFRKKEIVSLFLLALPMLLGSLFYKTNVVVERFLSSQLPTGSIAFLGYAGKIVAAMLLFLTQGISALFFQRQSEHSAVMDFSRLRETLSRGLRAMILLVAPVVLLIVFWRNDLVRLAFQRGSFTPEATRAVSAILLAYLGYLVISAVGLPLVNTLYSLQLTSIVSLIGVGGFLIYVFFAVILSRRMGYSGIALSASLQTFVSSVCLFWVVIKKIGTMDARPLLSCLARAFCASMAAIAIGIPSRIMLRPLVGPDLTLLFSVTVAVSVYGAALLAMRSEELRFISIHFRNRVP